MENEVSNQKDKPLKVVREFAFKVDSARLSIQGNHYVILGVDGQLNIVRPTMLIKDKGNIPMPKRGEVLICFEWIDDEGKVRQSVKAEEVASVA